MPINLFGPSQISVQRTNLDYKCTALMLLIFISDVGKAMFIADDCLAFGFFLF